MIVFLVIHVLKNSIYFGKLRKVWIIKLTWIFFIVGLYLLSKKWNVVNIIFSDLHLYLLSLFLTLRHAQ